MDEAYATFTDADSETPIFLLRRTIMTRPTASTNAYTRSFTQLHPMSK